MKKYIMKYNNRTGCHIICVVNDHINNNNTPSNDNIPGDNNNNSVYSIKK